MTFNESQNFPIGLKSVLLIYLFFQTLPCGIFNLVKISNGLIVNDEEPRNIFDVVYRSFTIMMTRQRRANLQYADVVFRPEVGHILAFDTTRIQECIEAGEREAQQKIQEVLSLIK